MVVFSLSCVLFLAICLLEFALHAWLALTHRIPIGHEGMTYFLSQYFYLNDTVFSRDIPQWIPYMGHGTLGSIWYASQASIGQLLMLTIAPLLKEISFDLLFNVGIYIDHLVLITGAWLLAGQYYRSPLTRFFTVLALSACTVWSTQTWFNFHFYYFLPFIFYFFHRFVQTRRWRYFLAAGHLVAFQTLGNAAYFIPITSMVVCFYAVSYLADQRLGQVKEILYAANKWKTIIILGSIAASLLLAVGVILAGIDETIHYSLGRDRGNNVPLATFIHHGGNLDWHKWIELIVGSSPALDYTLYMGLVVLVFFILGLRACMQSKQRQVFFSMVFLLLFSMGTVVAVAMYYCWPCMKMYRHLALVSPIIKMFCIFIAGFGFEKFFLSGGEQRASCLGLMRWTVLLLLLLLTVLFISLNDGGGANKIVRMMVDPGGLFVKNGQVHLIPGLPIMYQAGKYVTAALFKGLLVLAVFYVLLCLLGKKVSVLICAILILSATDLYVYKWSETSHRSVKIAANDQGFLRFQQPVFKMRRTAYLSDSNARGKFLDRLPASNGSPNCMWNAFAFADELGSTHLIYFLEKPFDRYLRAIGGRDPFDQASFPPGLLPYRSLTFPMYNQAALKMSAFTQDKILFFSNVVRINSEKDMFQVLSAPNYTADVPVVLDAAHAALGVAAAQKINPLFFYVTHFSANRLSFKVGLNQEGWVYIAENFSPYWQATVNGQLRRIYLANGAYQAIALDKGVNDVQLRYNHAQIRWQNIFWTIAAFIWTGVLLIYIGRICWGLNV